MFGRHRRPIFLVNLPVGVLTLVGAAVAMPGADGSRQARLDLRGVGLLTVALLLLSFPLAEGRSVHWPAWCFAMLVLSLPFFAAFALWERRLAASGGQPLVNPVLVHLRGFRSGNAVFLAFFASNAGLFFILAMQLQSGLGYTALESGLLFAPLGIAFTAVSLFVPKIAANLGLRVLSVGYGLNALGYLVLLPTAALRATDSTARSSSRRRSSSAWARGWVSARCSALRSRTCRSARREARPGSWRRSASWACRRVSPWWVCCSSARSAAPPRTTLTPTHSPWLWC